MVARSPSSVRSPVTRTVDTVGGINLCHGTQQVLCGIRIVRGQMNVRQLGKRNVPCCACIPRGSRQAIRTIINSLLFIDDDWLILLVVVEECQYSIHECLSFRISTYGFKRESQYKSLVVALVGHTGT